jgi:hypothetical protein
MDNVQAGILAPLPRLARYLTFGEARWGQTFTSRLSSKSRAGFLSGTVGGYRRDEEEMRSVAAPALTTSDSIAG